MFDWSDLRYLLAVAREGSSLAAARALRVNQSTVHRRRVELECAFRRLRPLIPVDRDHLFRLIATSVARVLLAPLDGAVDVSLARAGQARQEAVPVVNRRDPRATRSALTADGAARVGGPC
ncbi:MAG: helix-turn-helix domain-containing protein [Hyphomicrobiales bacterium]